MVPLMYHVSHGESSLGFSYRVRIVRYPMAKIGLSSQSSNDRSLGSIGSAGSFTPFLDYGLGMQSIAQSEKSVDSSKTRCGLPWTYGQELDCDTKLAALRLVTCPGTPFPQHCLVRWDSSRNRQQRADFCKITVQIYGLGNVSDLRRAMKQTLYRISTLHFFPLLAVFFKKAERNE